MIGAFVGGHVGAGKLLRGKGVWVGCLGRVWGVVGGSEGVSYSGVGSGDGEFKRLVAAVSCPLLGGLRMAAVLSISGF